MLSSCMHRLATPTGWVIVVALVLALGQPADGARVRIKDLARFQNQQQLDLIGYGLVIGLDGTGDGSGTQFTIQSLVNMMQRMGLTVDKDQVKVKNVAAVMITAKVSSHMSVGSYFDVTVSSVGDAKSLQGGTLLMTPLSSADGTVYGMAQGPVSIGGFNVQLNDGNRIFNNYTLVGRVPNGGKMTSEVVSENEGSNEVLLQLNNPDFTTAYRVSERINVKYGLVAVPIDAGTVRMVIPDSLMHPTYRVKFLADVGHLEVIPDNVAKVVINEKTGTIVAGAHVTIEPVAIAHGTITVNIQSSPVISQPAPFSQGETVISSQSAIQVQDETARVVHLKGAVHLSDVAKALNRIGATPRDIIAIFQALKQAGALRSELVIL